MTVLSLALVTALLQGPTATLPAPAGTGLLAPAGSPSEIAERPLARSHGPPGARPSGLTAFATPGTVPGPVPSTHNPVRVPTTEYLPARSCSTAVRPTGGENP